MGLAAGSMKRSPLCGSQREFGARYGRAA